MHALAQPFFTQPRQDHSAEARDEENNRHSPVTVDGDPVRAAEPVAVGDAGREDYGSRIARLGQGVRPGGGSVTVR